MLSNSVVAGFLASGYVLALVLQLNPSLPFAPARLLPLAATISLFYTLQLAVVFYVALVGRQLLAREPFSPAWVSVGVLVWLGAAASAAGAALMLGNLRTFALAVEPRTSRALVSSAFALVASAALFLVIALLRGRSGPRGRAAWAVLAALTAAASLAAPMAFRGPAAPARPAPRPTDIAAHAGAPDRAARVTVIAIDAGSLDYITSAAAEGRLPNFGRVLDAGAVMRMATLHPTSADAVWAAVATGKMPQKNGVRSAAAYQLPRGGDVVQLLPDYCYAHGLVRFGFLVEQPLTSAALRARPVWSILSALDIRVGVVAWPLTHPAPAVNGYLVSDAYWRLSPTPSAPDDASAIFPPALGPEVAAAAEAAATEATLGASAAPSDALDMRDAEATRAARVDDRIAQTLDAGYPAQVTLVRYQSLDPIGHYFLRYALPSEFGDVSDEEVRRHGSVLDEHYAIVDGAVGRAIASLGPDDLLLVASGYGMEPIGFLRRLLEQAIGDPNLSGTHEAAPDGFLMAYGASVARGRLQARASVVDVVPTVLYYLGLPIGRDMDGYARTDLFHRRFTDERPITFIPTYER